MSSQGKRLKRIRQEIGLSQDELGSVLGISKQFFSNIENDRTKLNNDKLVLLCENYNVNINYLLTGKGEMFIGQHKETSAGIDEAQIKALFDKFMAEKGLI